MSWECPSKDNSKINIKDKHDGKGKGNNKFSKGSFIKDLPKATFRRDSTEFQKEAKVTGRPQDIGHAVDIIMRINVQTAVHQYESWKGFAMRMQRINEELSSL